MSRIGLALGSGAARGCAHIGVINALERIGVKPDVVCGCSIGAVVGAAYTAGNLARLDRWMRALTRRGMFRYFELGISGGGFIDSTAFNQFLVSEVCDEARRIEELEIGFAAVATEIRSGREVWLTKGAVLDAVRASISLPGLFRPVAHDDGWLVDGGLVNPVPVSLCRALGADVVIAVNLNADIVGKNFVEHNMNSDQDLVAHWWRRMSAYSDTLLGGLFDRGDAPGLIDSLTSSFHIMQDRITRSRMAGDPPEVTLSPRLAGIGLLEFYRASAAITEGEASVNRMARDIEHAVAR